MELIFILLIIIFLSSATFGMGYFLAGNKTSLPSPDDLYLITELDHDDVVLSRDYEPDIVFKGMLLAEYYWSEKGFVDEWFRIWKSENKYVIALMSKKNGDWVFWDNSPKILTIEEFRKWLYKGFRDTEPQRSAQQALKRLIKKASEVDPELKNVLFERVLCGPQK